MEIDLQVNFKSMKNQTTLHKNIPHMSSAVSKGKEHSQRHRSWKVMCLAGMSKRACFTCKTSQYVNISERFTQVVQNTHMHNRFHSQQACLVFWRIDTYSQLSNNLHICSLKILSFLDWRCYLGLSGKRKQNLYDSLALRMFLFMSSYLCQGIHPVKLGHRGHFHHISGDVPIHVALPTTHTSCLLHTYVHNVPPDFGSRCALLPAQSGLPAEERALPWQRAKRPDETEEGD